MITATLLLAALAAQEPRFEVLPPEVRLDGARDFQSLLVLEHLADGTQRDRTGDLRAADLPLGLVWQGGALRADALRLSAQLGLTVDGHRIELPVEVYAESSMDQPGFRNDVVPRFTSAGCNAGACHGSAQGQDGFHLSLFGYDPNGDHHRLVNERPGRRLDGAFPARSLLLAKATGQVPHTGGALLQNGDPDLALIQAWIQAGAPSDAEDVPNLVGIEVFPRDLVLSGAGESSRVLVRARYSDGHDRDVSRLVRWSLQDASIADVEGGRVQARSSGLTFLCANFGPWSETLTVLVHRPGTRDYAFQDPADGQLAASWVDELVGQELRRRRRQPASLCDDATFLRRVTLDLAGRLPTEAERRDFLREDGRSQAGRRALRIDELLASEEFLDGWVQRLAELLRVRSEDQLSPKAARLWHRWLRDSLHSGATVAELVSETLTATGGTFEHPAVNAMEVDRDPKVIAETMAQGFLGLRLQCAQCHDHPFDRWTQNDYYGMVAFFPQVARKDAEDPRERIVFDRRSGETRHPITNAVVPPRFLGGDLAQVQGRDRRAALAEWMLDPANPWFAKNWANRVFAACMGQGLVEPVDDVRVSNPPGHPALLQALAERLAETNYDLVDLTRTLCNSRLYQRVALADPAGAAALAHQLPRRLRAETLADALAQVTGHADRYEREAPGERAMRIADGSTETYFLRTFGRATRDTACACEVDTEPSLSQALHLINGSSVHDRIRSGGRVQAWLDEGRDAAWMIDRIYTSCLVREPTAAERKELLALIIEGGGERREVIEDLFWSLLGSPEFLFQH